MIVNNHVTGRQVGDPLTDLGLRILRFGGCKDDALMNYESTAKSGRKLRSTTIFIRDPKDKKLIGAICINFDLSDYEKMKRIWENFYQTTPFLSEQQIKSENERERIDETFARSPKELLEEAIKKGINRIGRPLFSMNKDDKIRLVQLLDKGGIFLIKGAIDEVARELSISRYTVYNYLKESRVKEPKGIL
jgi:predicted transcriptional regulator YheO